MEQAEGVAAADEYDLKIAERAVAGDGMDAGDGYAQRAEKSAHLVGIAIPLCAGGGEGHEQHGRGDACGERHDSVLIAFEVAIAVHGGAGNEEYGILHFNYEV